MIAKIITITGSQLEVVGILELELSIFNLSLISLESIQRVL